MTVSTTAPKVSQDRRVLAVVADIARGGLAGAASGLLVGGIGGRVAMRLSAIVASDATGRLTENGNRVGEFTASGTMALLVFGGLFSGLLAGVVWVVTYPWIKDVNRRWVAAGALAVALGGPILIDADNRDFFILAPAWFHVGLFVVLLFMMGAVVSGIDRWLESRLPSGDGNLIAPLVVYTMLAGAGAPALLLLFGSYFTESLCGCESPARPAGVLLLGVASMTSAAWWVRIRGSELSDRLRIAAVSLIAGAALAGVIHTVAAIALIA